jgi:hypothetical protein
MRLCELASLIRSKNAGPFNLTFDILFSDEDKYQRVKNSDALTPAVVAKLYRCPVESVRFFVCDNAKAFKFTIPMPVFQGDLGNADMHGGQQFAPLMDLEV